MGNILSNNTVGNSRGIDVAQQGIVPSHKTLATEPKTESKTRSLEVLSVKSRHFVVRENQSDQKFLLEKSALEIPANTSILKGDKLILLNINQQSGTFLLQRHADKLSSRLTKSTLKNVATAVNAGWPDLPINAIKQTSPVIINQVNVIGDTQQATELARALVNLASSTGKPSLKATANGEIKFINSSILQDQALLSAKPNIALLVDKNIANTVSFVINAGPNNFLTLNIPLNGVGNANPNALTNIAGEQLKLLSNNPQKIVLTVDVANQQSLLSNIITQGSVKSSLSELVLKDVNRLLHGHASSIKKVMAKLIFSNQSGNLQSGIVLEASKSNLLALGLPTKQHLMRGVSALSLPKNSVLITHDGLKSKKIDINLLAKPTIIKLNNSAFSALTNANSLALDTSKTGRINAHIPNEIAASNDTYGNSRSNAISMMKNTPQLAAQNTANESGSALNTANVGRGNSVHNKSDPILSTILKEQLTRFLNEKSVNPESANSILETAKTVIYRDLHQLLPKAQPGSEALPTLLKQLQAIGSGATGDLKSLIEQVSQQVNMLLPKHDLPAATAEELNSIDETIATQSVNSIKAMLTAHALPNVVNTPIQATSAITAQSGLLNGLVTMLQASLQAKLLAQQPQMLARISQFAPLMNRSPNSPNTDKNQSTHAKLLQDLSKLDPNGNLIGELNKVLSAHSLHKISGAEASLQQHDSFYYILPNMFSPEHKDIEIVIKREQNPSSSLEEGQHAWLLNMKLDIGKSGEVLAKVKLANNTVDLNLYASNAALKSKIMHYLPYLNKRLTSLGLQVQPHCFLGKIPDTLHKTNYQMVQTYV